MQELLLIGSTISQDPKQQTQLLTSKLLYLTPAEDRTQLLSTKLLYLAPILDSHQLLTTKLLYLVPEA